MVCSKRWFIVVSSFSILLIFALIGQNSSAHAQADIALSTLHDSQDPVSGKSDFSYNLRLFNYGNQPAKKARVTLPIPQGLTFISVSPEQHCKLDKTSHAVECDFGTLQADASKPTDMRVMLRHGAAVSTSYTLTASAHTSSMELITSNNGQSETTTFSNGTIKGPDIGITRLEEVTEPNDKNKRSFDIVIKNLADQKAVDAKLVVMIPSLLEFAGMIPTSGCEFEADRGRLSCKLDALESFNSGGEEIALRLNLLDRSQTLGAVQLKALLVASGDDVDIRNDLHKLIVTLGVKAVEAKPFEPSSVAKAEEKDAAPEVTAAIEKEAEAEPVSSPEANSETSSEASSGGSTGASGTSASDGSAADKGSSFFDNFTNLFSGGDVLKQNAGPSGGDVDFQIQSFETNPDNIPAGSTFTLNTELINNGPGAANNATLDIDLPQGVKFVSGPAGCVHDGNPPTGPSQISCSFGNIANAATQSVPIILRAVVAGSVIKSFSAEIDSSSDETNATNNTQSVNATITNGADLLLTFLGVPNPAVAGSNVTYGLIVTNQGLNIAQGASVGFNMPPGIAYVSIGSGGSGWSCSAAGLVVSGQLVTCSSGADIAADVGTVSFSIVGQIGVGSGTYTASGTVFSTITPDVDGNNDTSTFDLNVQPGTDLSVAKSVSSDPVKGDSQPSFTITVTNNGPITAQNLVLTDDLPVGFSFVSAIGAGWTCPAPAGQLVTCTRPNLAVGSSAVVITVDAPTSASIPEAGQTIINSASISSDTNDAVSGNDTDSVSFRLERDGVDLELVNYSRSPDPVAQGSNITSTFRVHNNGPNDSTVATQVTLLLSANETFVSGGGTSGWGACTAAGQLITCARADTLNVNQYSSYVSIISTANITGNAIETLSATACTSTDGGMVVPAPGDPVQSNNCVSQGIDSTSTIADLFVSKTAALDPQTTTDATQTYTLTVRNDGPDPAIDVHLTDIINNWVAAYNGRPATTITATTPAGSCTVSNQYISCDLNDILVGGANEAVVTIEVTRPVQGGAAVLNTASAYSNATGDNNRANNVASVTTQVEFVTDIELRSAVWTPNPVKAGVNATYVLTVRNLGRDVAQSVALQSQFGGDFTFISATPSQGTCAVFGSGAVNRLDCSIGTMGFGANQTVTVIVRPNHPAAADITNSTTVSTTTHETNLVNNDGGADLEVTDAEIDLDVAQTDLVDPIAYNPGVPADNLITYQVTVNNLGPSYATGVNFDDRFTTPVGSHALKFICDKAASGDSCVEATAGQHCSGQGTIANNGVQASINCIVKKGAADQGEMAAGATYTRYLMYEVLNTPVPGGETHQKEIVVTANEFDLNEADNPTNNKAVAQTTVRIRTDVAVSCAAPSIAGTPVVGSVNLRQPFDLKLTVDNNGPGDSQETTLTQNLPTGMVLTGVPSPDSGTCTGAVGGTSFTCALGVTGIPGTNVVTVPVRAVSFPSGGTYSNVGASVESNEIDTDAGNDSCAVNIDVVRSSIAGFVYEDHNDDGDMDGGETPIQGVTVRITGTDAYGNTVNTTEATDASGAYKFYNRSPSDGAGYTLTQTHPTVYADGLENAGGGTVIGGSRSTDVMTAIALGSNEGKVHYDFGELPADLEVVSKTPSLADVSILQPFNFTVLVQNNGPADAPNSQLFDSLPSGMELTGVPTWTTVPAAGTNNCTGIAGGTSLTCSFGIMAKDAQISVTIPVMNTTDGVKNNTATASTDRAEITLANNDASGSVTSRKSSIACAVYQDYDNDGVKDPGEPGIGSVRMVLTGTPLYGPALNLETYTVADGSCLFDNLPPSDGAGYILTQPTQPAGFNDGKENNSGAISNDTSSPEEMTPIVLAVNTHSPTHQFGERPPTGISGTVWCDDNHNGSIDGAEATRIAGVDITLSGSELGGAAITPITKPTDVNGNYSFPNLSAGTYVLTQTQNTAHACNIPGKATVGAGATTALGTADNANGSATYGNVISGIELAANDVAVSYNFGELRPASIAGTVFNDTNTDDVRDTGEPGIGGVAIALSCTDYRDRNYTDNTVTAADGTYSFSNLLPTSAAGCTVTETQPSGYVDGGELVGTVNGPSVGVGDDLDANSDNINTIVLASDAAGINYDFAERSAGLSGHVYVDSDNDGVLDVGEAPIAGVSINLSGKDDTGADVDLNTITDANGYYQFTGLKPSDAAGYSVQETTQPAAWADGKDTAGSAGGDDTVNDIVTGITLTGTAFATDYDFGEVGGALSGVVYTDLDNDGQQTGTESGIPGATLALSCVDVNGQAFSATTTTGGDGSYIFNDIPATNAAGCTITETQPLNTSDGLDRIGTLGGTLGNDILTAIPVGPGDEGFGYDFGEILTNPARISGTVWHDSNHDRFDNDGNPQIGWTVELINRDTPSDCQASQSIVATQTTNGAGDYAFEGVSPGTYGVQFRSPTGGYLYAGTQSGGSTGANISCGIGSIIVIAGDDIIDQDLPLDPSGVVYDSLTRIPVPGATVTITGPAGFNPSSHLVGGTSNVSQTTGTDGYYQFLLYTGAPTGDYNLSVGQPAGYIPQDSAIIPVCANTLNVAQTPTPALVQAADTAPTLAASNHNPASCPTSSAGLAAGAGSTQYFFTFNLNPGLPSANVVNNHIPLDPVTAGAFTVSKTTPRVNVSIGQLVPYTIIASNNIAATLPNIEMEDQIPPGFKYKRGSATLDGVRTEPVIDGRQLTWPALTFTANQKRTLRLLLIVGSGVSEGDYINRTWAENGFVQALASNIATAKVRVTPDPTFDCAGVIGKVFDDKNRNGYQDKGELGLANVRLATVRGLLVTTDKYGRYHVACADVPNPDRGSNFIMKLDSKTLPSGYRLTTENPRIIRLTRGKIGKLNFGVAIHRVVRLDVTRDAFTARGDRLKRAWESGISRLVGILDNGPSILRIAYARSHKESRREVRARISILKKHVTRLWRRKRRRVLVIETESHLLAQGSFKGRSIKK